MLMLYELILIQIILIHNKTNLQNKYFLIFISLFFQKNINTNVYYLITKNILYIKEFIQ